MLREINDCWIWAFVQIIYELLVFIMPYRITEYVNKSFKLNTVVLNLVFCVLEVIFERIYL